MSLGACRLESLRHEGCCQVILARSLSEQHEVYPLPTLSFVLFHRRLEAGKGVVPLPRDAIEEEARLGEAMFVQRPALLAAEARRGGDTGAGQYVQVLGDRLSRQFRPGGEFRDGQRFAPR